MILVLCCSYFNRHHMHMRFKQQISEMNLKNKKNCLDRYRFTFLPIDSEFVMMFTSCKHEIVFLLMLLLFMWCIFISALAKNKYFDCFPRSSLHLQIFIDVRRISTSAMFSLFLFTLGNVKIMFNLRCISFDSFQ